MVGGAGGGTIVARTEGRTMPRTRHLIVAAVCAVAIVAGWMAGRDVGTPAATTVATGTSSPRTGSVAQRGPRARAATEESSTESEEKSSVPAKPPGRLFVHVVASEDDAPIAGAVVRPSHRDGDTRSVTTDVNGDAQIDVPMTAKHPDAADAWFRLTAPGRVAGSVNAEVASGGEQRVTERLRPGFVIEGFVHDAAGRPIAGAQIAAMEIGAGAFEPVRVGDAAEADVQGRFRIDGLSFTSCVGFEIIAPGYVRRTLGRRPHDTKPVDVLLEPGEVIRGVVRTPNGAPANGARVTAAAVVADDERGPEVATRTGEDGTYVLNTLDVGHTWTLVAGDSDFMDSEASPEVTPGADARCDLTLRPAARVVIDLDFAMPHPPAIAHVTRPWFDEPDCPVPGRRTVVVTSEGKWRVEADVDGLCRAAADTVVGPGETKTVTLRFDEGASIAGVVVNDLGAPVVGAAVRSVDGDSSARESTSGADGRFVLKALRRVEHEVHVAASGHGGGGASKVVAPRDDLRLVVPRNGEVVARLRLPDGAKAPEKYAVHWNAYPIHGNDKSAWSGGGLLRSLPPADYILEIEVDGCVKWERKSVDVVAGTRTDLGEIVLDAGLQLSGRVVDVDGHGVPFVRVFADDDIGTTDRDGNFSWPHLAAGEHEVRVMVETDFLDASVPVTLTKDTPLVVVTLHRGALLHVRVVGAPAKDDEVMNVQAFAADAPVGEEAGEGIWFEGSLADGYVHRLPAGAQRIEVRRENDVLATKHVDLQEGEDVEIEIAIPK